MIVELKDDRRHCCAHITLTMVCIGYVIIAIQQAYWWTLELSVCVHVGLIYKGLSPTASRVVRTKGARRQDNSDRCTIIAIGCLFYFLALLVSIGSVDFRYETKYQRLILKWEISWVLAVD